MRKPMVTRTIKSTKFVLMMCNTETCEITNKVVMLSRTPEKLDKLMAEIRKVAETDTEKVVQIASSEEVEKLYGMEENEFLKYAKELPPRVKEEVAE